MNFAELSDDENDCLNASISELLDKIHKDMDLPSPGEEVMPSEEYDFQKFKTDYESCIKDFISARETYKQKSDNFKEIEDAILSIKSEKYLNKFIEILDDFRETEKISEARDKLKEATSKFQVMRKTINISGDCDMGNKYMCFICLKNGIDRYMEPCGHVVCSECFDFGKYKICPFCRSDIRYSKKLFICN